MEVASGKAFNILTKLSLASNKTSFIHKTVRRTIGTILINGGQPDRRGQSRLLVLHHVSVVLPIHTIYIYVVELVPFSFQDLKLMFRIAKFLCMSTK